MLYEDIPLTIPLHFYASKVSVMQNTGYCWRIRDNQDQSITQKNTELRNLKDRIKSMNLVLDFFCKEDVSNEIKKAFMVKNLRSDLRIFIDQCQYLAEEDAYVFMDLINEYIDKNIDDGAFESLRLIDRMKYKYVREKNYGKLLELLSFNEYNSIVAHEENGELYAEFPKGLFGSERHCVTREFSHRPLKHTLNAVNLTDESFELDFSLFNKSVVTEKDIDREVEVYLYDETSDKKIAFSTVSYETTKDETCGGIDKTDVRAQLDLMAAYPAFDDLKSYNIKVHVRDRFTDSVTLLRATKKDIKKCIKAVLLENGASIATEIIEPDIFTIKYDEDPFKIASLELEGDNLVITTRREEDLLITGNSKERIIYADENVKNHPVKADKLEDGAEIYAGGDHRTIKTAGAKRMFIKPRHNDETFVICTNRCSSGWFIKSDPAFAVIEEVTVDDAVAKIRFSIPPKFLSSAEAVEFAALSEEKGPVFILAAVKRDQFDEKGMAEIELDFTNDTMINNLDKGNNTLMVICRDKNGGAHILTPYCTKLVRNEIKTDEKEIVLRRSDLAEFMIVIKSKATDK